MKLKEFYYVYREGKEVHRIAKIVGGNAYGYDKEKKDWISMQGLMKIQNEVTDYEEISEEEAKKLTEQI